MPRRRKGSERSSQARSIKRSGREKAVRAGLAVCALVLGYAGVTSALANVIVKVDPVRAYALAPDDGQIVAAFADREFAMVLDADADSQPTRLAREALLQDPTAVAALNVLGLQAQLRNDQALTDRLFSYSVALSRRELRPQLWAIEEAVARGDIRQALVNYDVALRTSPSARRILFPVLASAISEPLVRGPLIDIMATGPVWGRAFIQHAARNSPDPQAVVQFYRAGTARGLPIEDAERARVVSGLVTRNLMNDAWAYYETFRPGVERSRSRDPDFDSHVEARAPFDWNIESAPGLSAAILQEQDGGFLDFAAPPSTRATVVTQTQLLPPGDYRLEGSGRGIDQPARSRPYWSLTCRAGPELGRVDVPNSAGADSVFTGQFTVPSGCPVQTLSLVARASDAISGVSGQIEHLELAPIVQ